MKKTNIAYWIFTVLLSVLILLSAIPNIMVTSDSIALFKFLGYPVYLIPFLGIAKALGAITLVIPGFRRLKEWAYAGITFDLAGALYSIVNVGADAAAWITFLIGFALIATSYILHHRRLKMLEERAHVQSKLSLQGA
jgi:hypothetical protein